MPPTGRGRGRGRGGGSGRRASVTSTSARRSQRLQEAEQDRAEHAAAAASFRSQFDLADQHPPLSEDGEEEKKDEQDRLDHNNSRHDRVDAADDSSDVDEQEGKYVYVNDDDDDVNMDHNERKHASEDNNAVASPVGRAAHKRPLPRVPAGRPDKRSRAAPQRSSFVRMSRGEAEQLMDASSSQARLIADQEEVIHGMEEENARLRRDAAVVTTLTSASSGAAPRKSSRLLAAAPPSAETSSSSSAPPLASGVADAKEVWRRLIRTLKGLRAWGPSSDKDAEMAVDFLYRYNQLMKMEKDEDRLSAVGTVLTGEAARWLLDWAPRALDGRHRQCSATAACSRTFAPINRFRISWLSDWWFGSSDHLTTLSVHE